MYRVGGYSGYSGCFLPRAHRGSFLLVVCLSLLTGCIGNQGTVVISQLPAGVHDTQLLDAFRNQNVTTILLASDYAVGSQFDKYDGPYQEGSPIIPVDRQATADWRSSIECILQQKQEPTRWCSVPVAYMPRQEHQHPSEANSDI